MIEYIIIQNMLPSLNAQVVSEFAEPGCPGGAVAASWGAGCEGKFWRASEEETAARLS